MSWGRNFGGEDLCTLLAMESKMEGRPEQGISLYIFIV